MLPDSWEIWLDTQISPIIAKWMAEYTGFVVKSSYSLGFNTLADHIIYQKAKVYGNVILISKDADFPELINRLGSPPKLINLKIGNCDNRLLWQILQNNIHNMVNTLVNTEANIVELE